MKSEFSLVRMAPSLHGLQRESRWAAHALLNYVVVLHVLKLQVIVFILIASRRRTLSDHRRGGTVDT